MLAVSEVGRVSAAWLDQISYQGGDENLRVLQAGPQEGQHLSKKPSQILSKLYVARNNFASGNTYKIQYFQVNFVLEM
jgi:hypothetical protein